MSTISLLTVCTGRLRACAPLCLALLVGITALLGPGAGAAHGVIVHKVLVIIYDPPAPNVYNPVTLTYQLAADLETASRYHGYKQASAAQIDIQIYGYPIIHYEETPKIAPSAADYHAILDAHGVCDLVNRKLINEVWLWSDDSGGFAEAIQAGKAGQIIDTNGAPLVRNDCLWPVDVMGYNFDREVEMAVEDYAHRTENVISHLLDNKNRDTAQPGDNWYEFDGQGYAGDPDHHRYCGNAHFAPNAQVASDDYDFYLTNYVWSDCEDWKPQHTGAHQWINCGDWGCNTHGYYMWWFQNMPGEANGMTKLDGNPMPSWWQMILKFDASICREHDGDVNGCNGVWGCAYYWCSNRCEPTGTSNCDAGCREYCGSQCRQHDWDVTGCDAEPGCAYYYCSHQCHPVGTSNCSAGCVSYCSGMCSVHHNWVAGCNAVSECAYYYCSHQCHPVGTSTCGAGCCSSNCRDYDGNVTGCDAAPGCSYYYCSHQCHPTGTSNCDAGCPEYC